MTSRKLLIFELETEEVVVATLLRTLKTTDWEVTVLGSELFLSKLSDVMFGGLFSALVFDSVENLSRFEWHLFDLVLLPNPKFMPFDCVKVFLNTIGSVPFGIGVFDSRDIKDTSSAINRRYDTNGSCLLFCCSFVYVSDLDFVNQDNALVRLMTSRKKTALVIPFKYPEVIERTKIGVSINVVVSGKVQAKRRKYLFAILSVVLASRNSAKPVHLYLNGGVSGIYGLFIFYLSRLVNRLFRNISIVSYKERVSEDEYCDNLRRGHINLLPLTSIYDDGKDSGAFYDSMQFNMVGICPDSHLRSIGSLHGAVSLGYTNIFHLIQLVREVMPQLEYHLAESYSKTEEYRCLDFRNYLINELNSLSTH